MTDVAETSGIEAMMRTLGAAGRNAARQLARADGSVRNAALLAAAAAIRVAEKDVLNANRDDVRLARERGLSDAMLDRLLLDPARIDSMAASLEQIAALPDPLGRILAEWERPNGLKIERVSVPLGVIGIIYESRPNVTADAAALCIKSGNAAILRGGSESYHSCVAIHRCIELGVREAGIDSAAVQIVPTTDRAAVGFMLSSMQTWLDVVVPRGGRQLVERVRDEARVPVIGHLEGVCHVYVHGAADPDMARDIVVNAKMRRPGICGAAETILVDRDAPPGLLHAIVTSLIEAGCEVRGDARVVAVHEGVVPATDEDWQTEYLDAVVAMKTVAGPQDAVDHIARYGSGHTESIVTSDPSVAERFLSAVDSAIVLHNASTQFADGGEFGMGAEIGIATGRVHARGPVGAEQLTSYKYVIRGSGQIRPR